MCHDIKIFFDKYFYLLDLKWNGRFSNKNIIEFIPNFEENFRLVRHF